MHTVEPEKKAPEEPVFEGLAIDETIRRQWSSLAAWSLAIAVCLVIYIAINLFSGLMIKRMPSHPGETWMENQGFDLISGGFSVFFFGILTLYYFMTGSALRRGLRDRSIHSFEEGMTALKRHYIFVSVVSIIYTGIVGLIFVLAVLLSMQ